MGPPEAKQNIILTVGRIFADNGTSHHKRHDELIKAFLRLDRPGWELHIAGSTAEDENSRAYLKELQKLAKSHSNIHLHPNMPFNEVRKLRRQAAIYWHATGLGYDSTIYPENQEHFGMVTVEAMSAGVVPIVFGSAGQLEVVRDGQDGVLWSSIDQLLSSTRELIDNPKRREAMSRAAIVRAQQFDRQTFVKQIDKLILGVSHE
jgi:glycosyltransferase involved in cell wall biosynthesis